MGCISDPSKWPILVPIRLLGTCYTKKGTIIYKFAFRKFTQQRFHDILIYGLVKNASAVPKIFCEDSDNATS